MWTISLSLGGEASFVNSTSTPSIATPAAWEGFKPCACLPVRLGAATRKQCLKPTSSTSNLSSPTPLRFGPLTRVLLPSSVSNASKTLTFAKLLDATQQRARSISIKRPKFSRLLPNSLLPVPGEHPSTWPSFTRSHAHRPWPKEEEGDAAL